MKRNKSLRLAAFLSALIMLSLAAASCAEPREALPSPPASALPSNGGAASASDDEAGEASASGDEAAEASVSDDEAAETPASDDEAAEAPVSTMVCIDWTDMVCIDWTDFVSYGGALYRGDLGQTTVSVFKIGNKLGEVTLKAPAQMSGEEWETWQRERRELSEGCASMHEPGTAFYAVRGDDGAIAVRSGGKYYLYRRSESLPGLHLEGYSDVRLAWREELENKGGVVIRSQAELGEYLDGIPGYNGKNSRSALLELYNDEFFASHILAAVVRTAGSGSVRFSVTDAALYDGTLTVSVYSHVPEKGTCDMAAWLLLAEISADADVKIDRVEVVCGSINYSGALDHQLLH